MDLSLGMKYTNMIIVAILALRFLIKLRFPANTPISEITIRLPYGMNCIYLKLLVRYPRCRSAIVLFSICAAIRAGREPGPITQQQQVVQGEGAAGQRLKTG